MRMSIRSLIGFHCFISPLCFFVSPLLQAQNIPPTLVSFNMPPLPAEAVEQGAEGWVQLEFCVSAEGEVHSAKIVELAGIQAFAAAAVEAVKTDEYQAGQRNGKPIEVCGKRATVVFTDPDVPMSVSEKIENQYRDLHQALANNDVAAAQTIYDAMSANKALKLTGLAIVDFSAARLAYANNDLAEALRFYNRAVMLKDHYLSKQIYAIALEQLFVINYQLQRFGDALHTYHKLQNLAEPSPNFATIKENAEKLAAQFSGQNTFKVPVSLDVNGHWSYRLFRNKLSFSSESNQVSADRVILSCDSNAQVTPLGGEQSPGYYETFGFSLNHTWEVAGDASQCQVQVQGPPAGRFLLLQHP